METGRRPTADRTLVPNRFVVNLNPEELAGFDGVADELASDLADEALSFARAHHYALADRPRVDLVADPAIARSDIRVEARFASATAVEPGMGEGGSGSPHTPDGQVDPTATVVFTVPRSTGPQAVLHVTDPDGRSRTVAIGAGGLSIGRAEDNDLVARDGRVSRHHGRIVGRRGTLVYADLGSTNGSKVNGEPVSEVVLGVGDQLQIGDTILVLEDEDPG